MRILVFLVMLAVCRLAESQRKKKHNQEVRFRAEASMESGSISSDKPATVDVGVSGETVSFKFSESTVKHGEDNLSSSCSPCIGVDRKGSHLSTALRHFWKKSFDLSDDCLCNHFHSKQDDALGKALSISLNGIPNFRRKTKMVPLSKGDQRNTVKNWDILGPINVGKLELDGDPTFDLFEGASSLVTNPIEYLLAMDDNSTVFTELASEARVSWRKYSSKANGQMDLHYNLPWNEIAQGLSSTSVYEWQGWARATTFVATSGSYLIDCLGPHTLYLWNDHKVHTLTSDVYRGQAIRASVDLKAGIVGVVIPLRAVVQAQLLFSIQPIPGHVVVYPPQNTPHLLELENKRGFGMLVSGVFLLPVQNVFTTPVTVTFAVESPIDEEEVYHVREARRYEQDHNNVMSTTIAPGQTMAFPLELVRVRHGQGTSTTATTATSSVSKATARDHEKTSNDNSDEDDEDEDGEDDDDDHDASHHVSFLRCAENNRRVFQLVVSASRGVSIQVPLELECRRWDQSFHVTYLSHDDSVGQAAVILPLDVHSPSHHRKMQWSNGGGDLDDTATTTTTAAGGSSSSRRSGGSRRKIKKGASGKGATSGSSASTSTSSSSADDDTLGDDFAHPQGRLIDRYSGYPALLTYHGSGIAAQNHADAHKVMPSNMKEYLFGVRGYYVIAPSRFGAHNWEGVGEYTGREALFAIAHRINTHFVGILPRLTTYHGIIAGHSMGGHGAWVTATNMPDRFTCALPTAGWIKKSEYGTSNDFFQLDIATTYADASLKKILEQVLSEYHVDALVPTLRTQDVHIRVGTHDMTTHAWYSRRMYRLLMEDQRLLQQSLQQEQLQQQQPQQMRSPTTTTAATAAAAAVAVGTRPAMATANNVSLEEVAGKQHWWWDTAQDNDGGVLNDPRMRAFYQHCLTRSREHVVAVRKIQRFQRVDAERQANHTRSMKMAAGASTTATATTTEAGASPAAAVSVSTASGTGKNEALLKENAEKYRARVSTVSEETAQLEEHVAWWSTLPCHRNLSLVVVNPATHQGLCGVRVLQQTKALEPSRVDVSCTFHIAPLSAATASTGAGTTTAQQSVTDDTGATATTTTTTTATTSAAAAPALASRITKICTLRASNVRRLTIRTSLSTVKKATAATATTATTATTTTLATSIAAPMAHNIFADADVLIVKPFAPRVGMGSETVRLDLKALRNTESTTAAAAAAAVRHLCFAPYPTPTAAAIKAMGNAALALLPAAKWCDAAATSSSSSSASSLLLLQEKQLVNYGPLRRVYDRPFCIVYGTPPNQALRQAMRDFAVYMANAHFQAHRTFVPVLSDVEFRTGYLHRRHVLPNIIFVGDTTTNKLLKATVAAATASSSSSSSSSAADALDVVQGLLPGNVTFTFASSSSSAAAAATKSSSSNNDGDGDGGGDEGVDIVAKKSAGTTTGPKRDTFAFSVHTRIFDEADQAIAFTMPLHRIPAPISASPRRPASSKSWHRPRVGDTDDDAAADDDGGDVGRDVGGDDDRHVAMGVVIHGNSIAAYHHLSRLAWPVIPPMVRAPFALYLPDYVVIDRRIWSRGPGGIVTAGFWDSLWKYDAQQSYWR